MCDIDHDLNGGKTKRKHKQKPVTINRRQQGITLNRETNLNYSSN